MSDQEINIAIAEACGWRHNTGEEPRYGGTYRQAGWTSPEGVFTSSTWNAKTSSGLPDYCNSLDAMHEAEKVLTEKGVNAWWSYVAHINRNNPTQFGAESAVHATARQRAEAFLRTVGKWKEAK